MKKPLGNPPEHMLSLREGQQRDTEHICCGQPKIPKSHHYNTGAICEEPKGCPPQNSFMLEALSVTVEILKMTKLG